jgi:hypothetical protein
VYERAHLPPELAANQLVEARANGNNLFDIRAQLVGVALVGIRRT